MRLRTGKTCRMTMMSSKEVLTRLDANTWASNVGPGGLCNMSRILTLWRDPSSQLWNYKQVRTLPENERGPLCKDFDRVSVSEWRWNGRKGRKLGCEYMD